MGQLHALCAGARIIAPALDNRSGRYNRSAGRLGDIPIDSIEPLGKIGRCGSTSKCRYGRGSDQGVLVLIVWFMRASPNTVIESRAASALTAATVAHITLRVDQCSNL